jgi:hypothetical protein
MPGRDPWSGITARRPVRWQHIGRTTLLICTEIGANRGRQLHSALTNQCRESLFYNQLLTDVLWNIFRCKWWIIFEYKLTSCRSRATSSSLDGNGQAKPASAARRKYSPTVGRLMPQVLAICRLLRPWPNLRRSTSLIFRMDNLFAGI